MVGVFACFVTLSFLDFKEMGFGLAVAVLIDATIIRGVLLPASMTLLGDWNWYLPRWLQWLPALAPNATPLRPSNPRIPKPPSSQSSPTLRAPRPCRPEALKAMAWGARPAVRSGAAAASDPKSTPSKGARLALDACDGAHGCRSLRHTPCRFESRDAVVARRLALRRPLATAVARCLRGVRADRGRRGMTVRRMEATRSVTPLLTERTREGGPTG